MGKRHIPEAHTAHPNVTPLIDIVMCLIIFFMLVAKIGVTTGADTTIQPPETILGVAIKDLGNTLTLNVRGGPRITEPIVTALVEKGDREPREIKILEQRGAVTDRPLERVLGAFQKNNPNAKVIILGEKELQLSKRAAEDDLAKGRGNASADARKARHIPAGANHPIHALVQAGNGFGRPAIGSNFEWVFALRSKELGHRHKAAGDFGIGKRAGRSGRESHMR